jgi:hypothetical protein
MCDRQGLSEKKSTEGYRRIHFSLDGMPTVPGLQFLGRTKYQRCKVFLTIDGVISIKKNNPRLLQIQTWYGEANRGKAQQTSPALGVIEVPPDGQWRQVTLQTSGAQGLEITHYRQLDSNSTS